MNDKLTDQNRSTLIFVTIILFYIIYSIVDAKLNYYEIRYKTTAIVVDMYTEYNDDGFSRETNYLHIKYGDNDYGRMKTQRAFIKAVIDVLIPVIGVPPDGFSPPLEKR